MLAWNGNKVSGLPWIMQLDARCDLQRIIEVVGGCEVSRGTTESRPLVLRVWKLRPRGDDGNCPRVLAKDQVRALCGPFAASPQTGPSFSFQQTGHRLDLLCDKVLQKGCFNPAAFHLDGSGVSRVCLWGKRPRPEADSAAPCDLRVPLDRALSFHGKIAFETKAAPWWQLAVP